MDLGLLCTGKAVPFPDPFHESVRIDDKANFSVGGNPRDGNWNQGLGANRQELKT